MSDKHHRRQKRREKRAQQQRKREIANRRVLRPDEIKPLEIDGSVNLYDYMKANVNDKALEASFHGLDLHKYMANVDKTLDHFKIDLEKRSGTGNVLIRFGLLYTQQKDGKAMQIAADDQVMNWLADLWEYFNKLPLE